MIMMDDFEALKRKVEELKARKARAEGAYQEHVKRLKADYGVTSVKEAEDLLEEFKNKELRLAKKYAAAKKTFEAELAKGEVRD
jgi:predicted Zn-dependent protease